MIDLTNEVTVFVSTIGDDANYRDCIAHLGRQDCTFRQEIIDHVAPMSAAFQAMIDRCQTPYYIQVDEDMLLGAFAVRTLHKAISESPPTTAIVCYSLWDEHLQYAILGVKGYRHSVLKRYPYSLTVPHCDVEQLERMKADGYKTKISWRGFDCSEICLGRHGVHYTPATIFEAYYNRAAKSRLFPEWMAWVRGLLPEFRSRYEREPTDLNLFALLGFAAGMTTDLTAFTREKDWRMPNDDFTRLQADLNIRPPTELSLHVTSKCNLKCEFCPRQHGGVEAMPDMTYDSVILACNACPTIRSVCVAGFGEPLLCDNLESIIRECKQRSLFVGLITNGVILDEFAERLAEWSVDQVSVSLNAATAESHATCNGTNTFDRVLGGIRKAMELMPGRVGVSFVCQRSNLDECGAFLDLAAELGVAFVDFVNLLPHSGDRCDSADFWNRVLQPADQAAVDALRLHPHAAIVRTWPMPIERTGCNPRRCKSPYVSISLDAMNRVSPCRRVMPPAAFGTVIQHIPPPWKTQPWYVLRAALEGDRELPDVCKMCFANWKE